MSSTTRVRDRLVELRRKFHQYPEPAWREFLTTSLIVDELEAIGVDELYVGRDALDVDSRMAVPDDDELAEWYEQAREEGARDDVLEKTRGGSTGAVAVVEKGPGPVVGVRVDIDALFIEESNDDDHAPAAGGYRSRHSGAMHACGHDAHITIGLGVVEAVKESDFDGTLKVFFQPAEEESGGGQAMAESEHIEDVEYLFAAHVGMYHPTGEVVAGVSKPLAMSHVTATIRGESEHAGRAPNAGANAIQALGTAIENVYGIPRHEDGKTRVNIGQVDGGTASNIIAEKTELVGEVRGETTPLREYVKTRFERTLEKAAEMHGCTAEVNVVSESPRADSDEALVEHVYRTAMDMEFERVVKHDEFGGSEDATFLMQAVQANGGVATYITVGTDHPTSHHTDTFDVDESSLGQGVDLLTNSILRLGDSRPLR